MENPKVFEDEYAEYEDGLKISLRDLAGSLATQAGYYARVASVYADLKSLYDSSKMVLDDVKANLSIRYRQESEKKGEKTTEGKIESMIVSSKEYVDAKADIIEYGRWTLRYEGLLEAYRQRAFMLMELSRKTTAELTMSHH